MAKSSYDDINKNDERAIRLMALATMLQQAPKPVSSTTIMHEFYPDTEERTFRKQFQRDRKELGELGLVLRETPLEDGYKAWSVDREASFVQDHTMAVDAARVIYVLCHELTVDPGFAWRTQLRRGLAKMCQIWRGSALVGVGAGTQSNAGPVARHQETLLSCLARRQLVEVDYVDAEGKPSTPRLALLGTFGLQNRVYFVAQRLLGDVADKNVAEVTLEEESRIFRLSRMQGARAIGAARAYEIPADFDVRDHIYLPFQIGTVDQVAHIALPDNPSGEVVQALRKSGEVTDGVWQVGYASAQDLAAWCIAQGLHVLGPQELLQERTRLLRATSERLPFEPGLTGLAQANRERRARAQVGRPKSHEIASRLFVLLSSLREEGDVLSSQEIAATLDISDEEARHLIYLLGMSSGDSMQFLPVISDDEDREVFLMPGAQIHPEQLRLTQEESQALLAALATLGLDTNHELVRTVLRSHLAEGLQRGVTEEGTPEAEDLAVDIHLFVSHDVDASQMNDSTKEVLLCCMDAIQKECQLRFVYHPVAGGEAAERTVTPLMPYKSDGYWYLRAFDHDRAQERKFRIDCMELPTLVIAERPAPASAGSSAHLVLVRFRDTHYLELFAWDGLEILMRDENGTLCRLPHYGGSWLVRHLAACAGTIVTNDQDLAEQVLAEAQEQLGW